MSLPMGFIGLENTKFDLLSQLVNADESKGW